MVILVFKKNRPVNEFKMPDYLCSKLLDKTVIISGIKHFYTFTS